jgi:hypothetical protein
LTVGGLGRFNPIDARCGMELDEIDPEEWAKLEAATDEYIFHMDAQMDAAAKALCARLPPPSHQQHRDFSAERLGAPGKHKPVLSVSDVRFRHVCV